MSYLIVALVSMLVGVVLGVRYNECIRDFYELFGN